MSQTKGLYCAVATKRVRPFRSSSATHSGWFSCWISWATMLS